MQMVDFNSDSLLTVIQGGLIMKQTMSRLRMPKLFRKKKQNKLVVEAAEEKL